jgi:hypothetical protein
MNEAIRENASKKMAFSVFCGDLVYINLIVDYWNVYCDQKCKLVLLCLSLLRLRSHYSQRTPSNFSHQTVTFYTESSVHQKFKIHFKRNPKAFK